MRHDEYIKTLLRPITEVSNQTYVSDIIQVADVLAWLLDQTDSADVKMTSFSVSEEFLRRIYAISTSGLIKSLDVVLDFKATNKTLILWPFISQTVQNCYLSSNHSKILLVKNDFHHVSVVMSQNLTRGNRFEAGFISTDKAIYDSLAERVNYIIAERSIKFNDVYARTINSD